MPLARGATSINVSFVQGTHEVLTNTPDGIALADADTGQWRLIRKVAPPLEVRLSGDGRTLMIEHPVLEADLWLMEFRK
jgi:hypothetical protein